jgi:hypothetical protein
VYVYVTFKLFYDDHTHTHTHTHIHSDQHLGARGVPKSKRPLVNISQVYFYLLFPVALTHFYLYTSPALRTGMRMCMCVCVCVKYSMNVRESVYV